MTVGIDEVGRGSWAGPLVAAAVALKQPISGLADSKILSKKERQILDKQIRSKSIFGLGWITPKQVDSLGLTRAVSLAMRKALYNLGTGYDKVIIDGNYNFLYNLPKTQAIIKADLTISEVSAASIIAKVARDDYMIKIAKKYPGYYFEKHVGYGTRQHLTAIKRYGITPLHRCSYRPIQTVLEKIT